MGPLWGVTISGTGSEHNEEVWRVTNGVACPSTVNVAVIIVFVAVAAAVAVVFVWLT